MKLYKTEEAFKRRCYEMYQLDWLITHGYSIQDVFNVLREGYKDGCEDGEIDGSTWCDEDFNYLERYFEDRGLYGEIFVSEDEFYNSEYQDKDYMEYLLPDDMYNQYLDL